MKGPARRGARACEGLPLKRAVCRSGPRETSSLLSTRRWLRALSSIPRPFGGGSHSRVGQGRCNRQTRREGAPCASRCSLASMAGVFRGARSPERQSTSSPGLARCNDGKNPAARGNSQRLRCSTASSYWFFSKKWRTRHDFERVTFAFGGQRSIQLSYGCFAEGLAHSRGRGNGVVGRGVGAGCGAGRCRPSRPAAGRQTSGPASGGFAGTGVFLGADASGRGDRSHRHLSLDSGGAPPDGP